MLGDFNAVLDTKLDRSMVTGTPELSEQFKKYMENLGLRVIWREKHNKVLDYTYYLARHQILELT